MEEVELAVKNGLSAGLSGLFVRASRKVKEILLDVHLVTGVKGTHDASLVLVGDHVHG